MFSTEKFQFRCKLAIKRHLGTQTIHVKISAKITKTKNMKCSRFEEKKTHFSRVPKKWCFVCRTL